MTGAIEVASPRGGRLIVHDLGGKKEHRPLILCHATGFCGLAYRALGELLSEHFHVFAPDFAGHGDSSPASDYDWRGSALDFLAIRDAVAPGEPVFGFGHSFGGAVLLLAAVKREDAFEAAFCYEPIVLPGDPGASQVSGALATAARRRRSEFSSKPDALMRYASRPPLDGLQAGVLADYVEHGMREREDGTVELKCEPEVEAASFEAAGKPTLAAIAGVAAPVTVAAGGRTKGPTAGFAAAAAAALLAGRLVRYDFLGHFGPLEQPTAIAEGVAAGLASAGR